MADGEPAKKSDLKVRTLSAIVMVVVAGTALWLGGWVWTLFVLLVAAGVLWEWSRLTRVIAKGWWSLLLWYVAGAAYVGIASDVLLLLRVGGTTAVSNILGAVVATDIGAYFGGRTFGGPKIAPSISPSKTWSGLAGGMIAAGVWCVTVVVLANWQDFQAQCQLQIASIEPFVPFDCHHFPWWSVSWTAALVGTLIAIIAQTGDFFESWMKRRAGVKDSGNLIPGHGGLFDRLDGLLAVLFVAGVIAGIGKLF